MTMKERARSAYKPRAYSPFDDSARERQRHMGLLREDGSPNLESISVLSQVYAGQFYDDLHNACKDSGSVRERVQKNFLDVVKEATPKSRFLLMCIQYDSVYLPLPDPVWWMSGDLEMADAYTAGFINCLRQLVEGGDDIE